MIDWYPVSGPLKLGFAYRVGSLSAHLRALFLDC